jgi:hypothetical protein
MKFLKETGEMGQHDIEEGGEFYESAQYLKKAARHIQKLTNGFLQFVEIRPFDKYQGPYAACELLGRHAKLWFGNEDTIDPEYFLETSHNPEGLAGDVYKIAKLIKTLAERKYGMGEDILKYGTKEEVEFLLEYSKKNTNVPLPKKEKKLCAKCKKSLKHGHAKGGICDACANEEHLDKETR